MNAEHAIAGEKYLTKAGIPVKVEKFKGDKVVLRAETTGNANEVSKTYELFPYDENKIARDAKVLLSTNGKSKNGKVKGQARNGTLAQIIDPMLQAGKSTIKDIAAELKKKAAKLIAGRDVEANIRARLWSWKTRGYTVERDAQKRIRIVQKKKS